MQALFSTANYEGIVNLARELQARNVKIFATEGTKKRLLEGGIETEAVNTLTGFPEILDGRVKTLHPAIFGGILARRDNEMHMRELREHDFAPIDIVVVNLYP